MNRKQIRLLLVEDNPGDARLLEEAFREEGSEFLILSASDGIEAMEILRSKNEDSLPDLVLLDLNLPRKDGRTVLGEIKTDPDLKKIPVIVLTTSEDKKDIRTAYELHANCYIRKPVEFDRFMEIVSMIRKFWFDTVQLPGEK